MEFSEALSVGHGSVIVVFHFVMLHESGIID